MRSTSKRDTPRVSEQLSVVVPTHNRCRGLNRVLVAMTRQYVHPREIIVVDDCSSDETSNLCDSWARRAAPFRFHRIGLLKNLGPAAARNVGVAHAQGSILCFTDDDCEPERDWTLSIEQTFSENPSFAGVGGPVIAAGSSEYDAFFDYHRLHDPKFDPRTGKPLYLVTANAAYKRNWILKVGGFDEDLRRPGGEDPGISFKITRAGGELGFSTRAVVRHYYPDRIGSTSRMFRNYGYGACIVAHAYPPNESMPFYDRRILPYSLAGEAFEYVSRKPEYSSRSKIELSPPYLREIPYEISSLESRYRRQKIALKRRLLFHLLWVIFRASYYRGWKEAESIAFRMPHMQLPA